MIHQPVMMVVDIFVFLYLMMVIIKTMIFLGPKIHSSLFGIVRLYFGDDDDDCGDDGDGDVMIFDDGNNKDDDHGKIVMTMTIVVMMATVMS